MANADVFSTPVYSLADALADSVGEAYADNVVEASAVHPIDHYNAQFVVDIDGKRFRVDVKEIS